MFLVVIGLTLIAFAVLVVVVKAPSHRPQSTREPEWWPGFERDFRAYARIRQAQIRHRDAAQRRNRSER